MIDQANQELRRVTKALAEVSPTKPPLPDRHRDFVSAGTGRSLLVGLGSFAAVMAVGVAALLLSGGEQAPPPPVLAGPPTTFAAVSSDDSFLPRLVIDVDGFTVLDGYENGVDDIRQSEWYLDIDGQSVDVVIEGSSNWEISPGASDFEVIAYAFPNDGKTVDTTPTSLEGINQVTNSGQRTSVVISGEGEGFSVTMTVAEGALDPDTIAGAITYVDEESWRTLLPDDFITPEQRGAAIAVILEDVAVPDDLAVGDMVDPESLHPDALVTEYQLGAEVIGTIACQWVATWVDATDAGDTEAANKAAVTMAGSRQWPILERMMTQGDYPEAVWQFADAIAGDGTVTMGIELSVKEAFTESLCS